MTRTNPNSYRSYWSGAWCRHVFSVLVWAVVAVGVVGLFYRRTARFEVLGMAQGQMRQIAATCTGRLKTVPVQLFEKISRGQTLAVLDDEHIQAELATAAAEIQRLMAELVPTQERLLAEAANRETDWIATHRRFSVDVEQSRLRILQLRTTLETDRIMLEDLALEVKIAQELLEKQAITPYELQKVKVQYNTLAKKIEASQHLLEQAERDLKEAQRRRSEFARRKPQHPSVNGALEVIHKTIKVQEQRMEELLVECVALVLKSPFDGVVSQIQSRPGEAVLPGEPILTIAEVKPSEIIAYASETQASQIREKMVIELVKNSEPAQIVRSQVTYVGPVVEQMPVRLWRNPNIPQWGRPFLVKVPPQMKLAQGELVGIRRL